MKYNEAYKFPLKYDGISYVWEKDNGMVLQFFEKVTSNEFRYLMVKLLNGEDIQLSVPYLTYLNGDYYIEDKLFMIQRGWGHLTSPNGLNLSEDEAMTIQDDFADYVLSKLKA